MRRQERRATYHHGDLRAALLGTAAELLEECGASGVSLREIARRVGVSHAAPKRHFPDRRALLTAVAAQGFRELGARLARARDSSLRARQAPRERLIALGQTYGKFVVSKPALFTIIFRADQLDAADIAYVTAERAAFDALKEAVAACQIEGWNAKVPHDVATLSVWSIAHGLAMLWTAGVAQRRVAGGADLAALGLAVGRALLMPDRAPATGRRRAR